MNVYLAGTGSRPYVYEGLFSRRERENADSQIINRGGV